MKVAHAQLPEDPVKRWQTVIPVIADLKAKAKKQGLWNLFLSKAHYPEFGVPLTNLEVRPPSSPFPCVVRERSPTRGLRAVCRHG